MCLLYPCTHLQCFQVLQCGQVDNSDLAIPYRDYGVASLHPAHSSGTFI